MIYKLFPVICIASLSFEAIADDYSVNVTREDSNLYKVVGRNMVINTRYCYEYANYEDSILRLNGYSSEIIFLDSESRCDVKAVYQSVAQEAGNYTVTVSQEGDDWYEIWGQNLYIRTSLCLSLALGEDAVLSLKPGGFGMLHIGSDECSVEGVYSKLRI